MSKNQWLAKMLAESRGADHLVLPEKSAPHEFGDLLYRLTVGEMDYSDKIPRTRLSWPSVMENVSIRRRDFLRNGVQLAPWDPPPVPPTQ